MPSWSAPQWVLISALTLLWSGLHPGKTIWSSRLANLETTNAQANDEVAKAHADLIDARQQLTVANGATAKAEKEAARCQARRQACRRNLGPANHRRELWPVHQFCPRTVLKGKIILETNSSDAEAVSFARQMADMLKSAGYDIDENFGSPDAPGQPARRRANANPEHG